MVHHPTDRSDDEADATPWPLTAHFLVSTEFAVVAVAATAFVGFGLPLVLYGLGRLAAGQLLAGLGVGSLGLGVTAVAGWKFAAALAAASRRFSARAPTDAAPAE